MNDPVTITWVWERDRMRWRAELPDGSILIAQLERRGARRQHWECQAIFRDPCGRCPAHTADGRAYVNADQAQNAALAAWRDHTCEPQSRRVQENHHKENKPE